MWDSFSWYGETALHRPWLCGKTGTVCGTVRMGRWVSHLSRFDCISKNMSLRPKDVYWNGLTHGRYIGKPREKTNLVFVTVRSGFAFANDGFIVNESWDFSDQRGEEYQGYFRHSHESRHCQFGGRSCGEGSDSREDADEYVESRVPTPSMKENRQSSTVRRVWRWPHESTVQEVWADDVTFHYGIENDCFKKSFVVLCSPKEHLNLCAVIEVVQQTVTEKETLKKVCLKWKSIRRVNFIN